jgi:hypothetical protein
MLQRMRALRCLVFVETHDGIVGRFLGIATSDSVHWLLAHHYPWLEQSYINAQCARVPLIEIKSRNGSLEASVANKIADEFLRSLDKYQPKDQPPDHVKEWVFLENAGYWEHGSWINRFLLEKGLNDAFEKYEYFEDSRDTSQSERIKAILRRKGSFVALVDKDRVFLRLIDRKKLLEEIAAKIASVSDEQPSK